MELACAGKIPHLYIILKGADDIALVIAQMCGCFEVPEVPWSTPKASGYWLRSGRIRSAPWLGHNLLHFNDLHVSFAFAPKRTEKSGRKMCFVIKLLFEIIDLKDLLMKKFMVPETVK